MNKAILISIKPPHMANICNGDKTIEVRTSKALANATKKMIAEQGYAQFLAYCSKNEYLYRTNKGYIASNKPLRVGKGTEYTFAYSDEGKVVCSFKCYKVEEIKIIECITPFGKDYNYGTETMPIFDLLIKSRLDHCELAEYLRDYTPLGYAIHISDLNIFDKPKELIGFRRLNCDYKCPQFAGCDTCSHLRLTKAPQNFCYVEIEE